MNDGVAVPKWYELLWPTLKALEALGGSARVRELEEQLASELQLPDSVLDTLHREGSAQTAVSYNAAWSRTYLKKIGAVDNPSRGVWTITKNGRDNLSGGDEEELREKAKRLHRQDIQSASARRRKVDHEEPHGKHDTPDEQDWKEDLLKIIRDIAPDAFERLCQRILREAGFTKVGVTGRSGDGGVDGIGVLRLNLLSFPAMFQCKRFAGSVGASSIRDFRGAMTGRTEKALFITTGTFTTGAKREAVRDGAPPIDLIDGEDLCDLLKKYSLGVKVVEIVERVEFDDAFFNSI